MERKLEIPFAPLEVLKRFEDREGLAFLHSGLSKYQMGRYSILAIEPVKKFRFSRNTALVIEGGTERRVKGDFLDLLEDELSVDGVNRGKLPFYGGAIGCFSYEAGRLLESECFGEQEFKDPEVIFNFYDAAFVFDNELRETYLVAINEAGRAVWDSWESIARSVSGTALPRFELQEELRSNFEKSEFIQAVQTVRDYIKEGSVYQVNLSQRFEAECIGSPLDLFLKLSELNPAPYSAYMNLGYEVVISSSPERFLEVRGRNVTTRPIKGTRPVFPNEAATQRSELELQESEKDRSELLMIVDLERNDLGRVCEPGSVGVERLFGLERYATVIHQTADVNGTLEKGRSVFDCIRAMFPGGSITGAPKIRAMQIIEELERGPRGVYTGSIGYLDKSGNADFNIAIRTLSVSGGKLRFQVGGGIVWDSDPESEYEETLVKARAMKRALGIDE